MRDQELRCFGRVLECEPSALDTWDLLQSGPPDEKVRAADMILLGGSGHYSAAGEGEWLERALDTMRELYHLKKPTFASCWGFQAMARAMGGRCINDRPNAELGTVEFHLTAAGRNDPLFGQLPAKFGGQSGHEDHVVELPADAVLLASSDRVAEQAFCFEGRPIYCTQFHPELDCEALLGRGRAYQNYLDEIAGITYEQFVASCRETPEANSLLKRFVNLVFDE